MGSPEISPCKAIKRHLEREDLGEWLVCRWVSPSCPGHPNQGHYQGPQVTHVYISSNPETPSISLAIIYYIYIYTSNHTISTGITCNWDPQIGLTWSNPKCSYRFTSLLNHFSQHLPTRNSQTPWDPLCVVSSGSPTSTNATPSWITHVQPTGLARNPPKTSSLPECLCSTLGVQGLPLRLIEILMG